jgi:hypothetical protein
MRKFSVCIALASDLFSLRSNYSPEYHVLKPILVAARFYASDCGRLLTGIVGSNPAMCMNACSL